MTLLQMPKGRLLAPLLAATFLFACSANHNEVAPPVTNDAPENTIQNILVIGDSISKGAGALGEGPNCELGPDTDSQADAYPTRVAKALGANVKVLAWSGKGLVHNFDGSEEPTISTLLRSLKPSPLPDADEAPQLILIHVGTHDFDNYDPEPAFSVAYLKLLGELSKKYEGATILAMFGPMLHGDDANKAHSAIQKVVAQLRSNGNDNIYYMEFETDAGYVPGCAWYPSKAAHEMMADQILGKIMSPPDQ